MRTLLVVALLAAPLLLAVWKPSAAAQAFALATSAFAPEGRIPPRFTCSGEDLSPALSWVGAPEGTRSFALICDDPDAPAGLWVHWVLYNLPGETASLSEGIGKGAALPAGGLEGLNSWGKPGYRGPCPPPGKPHRYYFKLYALDAPLRLLKGATKAQVEAAMQGHLLAETQVMGTFER